MGSGSDGSDVKEDFRAEYIYLDNATEELSGEEILHRGVLDGGMLEEARVSSRIFVCESGMVYEFATRLSEDKPRAYKMQLADAIKTKAFNEIS